MPKRREPRLHLSCYAVRWQIGRWVIDVWFWTRLRCWRLEAMRYGARGGCVQIGPLEVQVAG